MANRFTVYLIYQRSLDGTDSEPTVRIPYKVGFHTRTTIQRRGELQTGNPCKLKIAGEYFLEDAATMTTLEAAILQIVRNHSRHIRGEWFFFSHNDFETLNQHLILNNAGEEFCNPEAFCHLLQARLDEADEFA